MRSLMAPIQAPVHRKRPSRSLSISSAARRRPPPRVGTLSLRPRRRRYRASRQECVPIDCERPAITREAAPQVGRPTPWSRRPASANQVEYERPRLRLVADLVGGEQRRSGRLGRRAVTGVDLGQRLPPPHTGSPPCPASEPPRP